MANCIYNEPKRILYSKIIDERYMIPRITKQYQIWGNTMLRQCWTSLRNGQEDRRSFCFRQESDILAKRRAG